MTRSQMAQQLGRRGGRARAARLSADAKRRIAALGGRARADSLSAARRVEDNFRYLAAIGELQGVTVLTRERTFAGRLPGIYREES